LGAAAATAAASHKFFLQFNLLASFYKLDNPLLKHAALGAFHQQCAAMRPLPARLRFKSLMSHQVCCSSSAPEVLCVGRFQAAIQQQDGSILQVSS
jgi:hypothetical protein